MKAWIFGRYGGPEVLEWADLPDPVAAAIGDDDMPPRFSSSYRRASDLA